MHNIQRLRLVGEWSAKCVSLLRLQEELLAVLVRVGVDQAVWPPRPGASGATPCAPGLAGGILEVQQMVQVLLFAARQKY